MKTCLSCGETLPFSEFQKNGKGSDGQQTYKARCKQCKQKPAVPSWKSPCTTCINLAHCRAILFTPQPLPCMGGFAVPATKAIWPVSSDQAAEDWRERTFMERSE